VSDDSDLSGFTSSEKNGVNSDNRIPHDSCGRRIRSASEQCPMFEHILCLTLRWRHGMLRAFSCRRTVCRESDTINKVVDSSIESHRNDMTEEIFRHLNIEI
jgi:hypothetical protein